MLTRKVPRSGSRSPSMRVSSRITAQVSAGREGRKGFAAVDDPVVAIAGGGGFVETAAAGTAHLRLAGEVVDQRAVLDHIAQHARAQIGRPLGVVGDGGDLQVVHGGAEGDRAVAPGEPSLGEHQLERGRAEAAEFLRNRQREIAALPQRFVGVEGKGVLAVVAFGVGRGDDGHAVGQRR